MDRRWWVLVSVGVGTFMSALDGSVVNTILPVLRQEFSASVAEIEWVSVVYLLVVSALLLGVGRAGDLYGHKRMYLAGYVIFLLGSVACGASGTSRALVGMRALQAFGAAMLFANSPAILTRAFPAQQRGRALGTQATFTYLGLTTGPSFGGWLVTVLGWRSVFFINVPVALAGIALAIHNIEDDRPETRRDETFDFTGAALFTAGLTSLLVALNRGHHWGWGSPGILGFFAASAALLTAFVLFERRVSAPMLDLSLFSSRTFSASALSALLNYVCLYSNIFVLPFLLIQGRGLSPAQAGLILTAQPIVMAVVAPFAGTLSDRVGSRLLTSTGMAILAAAVAALAVVADGDSSAAVAGALALVGFGVGLFVSPNNSALMGSAPKHRQGIAAAVLATARNAGMVLGIGLAGAVFTTVLARGGDAALVHGVTLSLWVTSGVALTGMCVALLRD